MKILCVSDQIDPLVYSSSIRSRYGDIDLILGAGDLPLDYLEFIVSSLNRPLFFVSGNHDQPKGAGSSYYEGGGFIHIGDTLVNEGGLLIAGLGGSKLYNGGVNQYSERAMYARILRLIPGLLFNRIFRGRFLDILLTHAAPCGVHDRDDPCHRGFRAFIWFIKTFKPRYLVHGHIHLYDLSEVRTTVVEKTTVINAYSQYILTI